MIRLTFFGSPTLPRLAVGALCLGISAGTAKADCTAPESGPPVCLAGIVTAPGYAVALVQQPGKPGLIRLLPNQSIADWTVSEIGPRFVVFAQDDQSFRLELNDHGVVAAPAAQTAGLRPGSMPPTQPNEEPTPEDMNQ